MMKQATAITCVFLDVGGVLLTNGWGHQSRALAAKAFEPISQTRNLENLNYAPVS